jgi:hypothetical protein
VTCRHCRLPSAHLLRWRLACVQRRRHGARCLYEITAADTDRQYSRTAKCSPFTEDRQHAWEDWGSGARDHDDPRKIMVSDLIGSCSHLRPIFPRSRHLPSPLPTGASQKTSIKSGCGRGPIAPMRSLVAREDEFFRQRSSGTARLARRLDARRLSISGPYRQRVLTALGPR